MTTGTMTSKGQITIPSEVRRALNLRPGDRLLFEVRGDELLVRPVHRRAASELLGVFKPTRGFPGTDEVRDEVARSLAARHDEEQP